MILSFDDVNYYHYMLERRLYLQADPGGGRAGLESWGIGSARAMRSSAQDLDAITDSGSSLSEEHPDFSPFGAKGCLSLTGYEGILGYRTQTDTKEDRSRRRRRPTASGRSGGGEAHRGGAQAHRLDVRQPHLGTHQPQHPLDMTPW